jgi:hypothetical protein
MGTVAHLAGFFVFCLVVVVVGKLIIGAVKGSSGEQTKDKE